MYYEIQILFLPTHTQRKAEIYNANISAAVVWLNISKASAV